MKLNNIDADEILYIQKVKKYRKEKEEVCGYKEVEAEGVGDKFTKFEKHI